MKQDLEFSFTTLNPASCGSKNGINILQLKVPFRLGKINVKISGDKMVIKTRNIRRFQFLQDPVWKSIRKGYIQPPGIWRSDIKSWIIDETEFSESPKIGPSYKNSDDINKWSVSNDFLWISEERHSSTYGPAMNVYLFNPGLVTSVFDNCSV